MFKAQSATLPGGGGDRHRPEKRLFGFFAVYVDDGLHFCIFITHPTALLHIHKHISETERSLRRSDTGLLNVADL